MMNRSLLEADLEIARLIESELNRQRNTLMLIPSENYASRAVMAASGSVLTNKYAEGYPKRRYYNGCDFYDKIEQLAIDRAKELFGVDHANVQPHTGTQANMAVYWALLKPGDRILAMSLAQGGHLSHGDKVNFSGFYYEPHFYGLDPETDQLNYDHIREVALEVQPKIIVCGASAYPRTIDFDRFRAIADEVGAYLLADIAHISGLVVAGQHPSPAATADMISTTTHKTLRGPRGALVMCKEEYQKKLDRAVFPGVQAGPLMNIVAAKAVCFKEAMEFGFKEYQRQIVSNAAELAKTLKEHDFNLVTDGTDNHLMLVRLTNKNITGRVAADLMEMAGMVVNKNMVPNDPLTPAETSGIRPGTPGVTTRGMKEKEMQLIGSWIARVIHDGRNADGTPNEAVLADVRRQVEELCDAFPIYPSL